MIHTRSRIVVVLAAAALALSACTSDAEPGSTNTQEVSPTGGQTTAPASTEGTAPSASASPDIAAEQEAKKDVKLGALSVDTKGVRSAEVAITNNTSKPSNYIVDLQLMSADGKTQLDTAMASAVGVAAGKTTKVKAEFASTDKLPKDAKITIAGVARITG